MKLMMSPRTHTTNTQTTSTPTAGIVEALQGCEGSEHKPHSPRVIILLGTSHDKSAQAPERRRHNEVSFFNATRESKHTTAPIKVMKSAE